MRPPDTVSLATVLRVSGSQVSTDVLGETVILNLTDGTYCSLNQVGSRVWNLLQSPRLVGDVQEVLLAEYAVDPDRLAVDLLDFLGQLVKCGLVESLPR